jgi:hypothetical protein
MDEALSRGTDPARRHRAGIGDLRNADFLPTAFQRTRARDRLERAHVSDANRFRPLASVKRCPLQGLGTPSSGMGRADHDAVGQARRAPPDGSGPGRAPEGFRLAPWNSRRRRCVHRHSRRRLCVCSSQTATRKWRAGGTISRGRRSSRRCGGRRRGSIDAPLDRCDGSALLGSCRNCHGQRAAKTRGIGVVFGDGAACGRSWTHGDGLAQWRLTAGISQKPARGR